MRLVPTSLPWLVIALLAFASGCSKSVAPATNDHAAVLRISQRNEPADLDPATAALPDDFFVIRALSEGLLVPNPTGGDPLPGAAQSYDTSADGLTYTFHLRPNARWGNGDAVTAADFVASFARVLTPATAAPKAHLFYAVRNARAFVRGEIASFSDVGFQAADPSTLVVRLAEPVPNFPLYVASGPWIPVNPRVVAAHGRKWTAPEHYVGNGPFTLVEWRAQQRIVVRKNPHYHGAAQVALAQIDFVRLDSGETEERAYRAGQIDVTMSVPQSKLDVYARDRSAELHRASLAETRFIAFNTTRPALQDARVRRALSFAIDRDAIVTRVLHGGQQPAERFLSPALLGESSPQTGVHHFDPARARALLAEAGYPGGKGFPHLEFSGWDRNPTLEAIQQMWREALGVEVEIVVREAKVHLAALNTGEYDIAFVTNLLDVRDPFSALQDFTTGAPNNFPHWHSPEFDQQLATAGHAIDRASGQRSLLAAERLLLDSAAVAPVYFNAQNWLMSPRVRGWEQDALWSRRYNDVHLELR